MGNRGTVCTAVTGDGTVATVTTVTGDTATVEVTVATGGRSATMAAVIATEGEAVVVVESGLDVSELDGMETGAGVGLEAAVLTVAPLAPFGLALGPELAVPPPGPVVAPAPAASRGLSSDC